MAGRSIVDRSLGEPDLPTPRPVIAAAVGGLEKGYTRYTPVVGIPPLRKAIARRYANT